MSLYLDTSLLVSALTNETSTSVALDWIAENRGRGFTTSRWCVTEFSSALAMKVRNGFLDDPDRRTTLSRFTRLLESFDVNPVQSSDFDLAAHLADHPDVVLRSGDALHLAVAIRLGLPLRTLDRKFVTGAMATGHDIRLVRSQ